MRRLGVFVIGLALVSSCAGNNKELAAVEQRLAAMEAEQQRMRAAIESVASEQRHLATELDQAEIERSRDAADGDDLAGRLEELKENDPPVAKRPSTGPDPQLRHRVLLGDAHVRGPDTALVTIVEWADFQCPFCGRVKGTLDEVEKKYGGQVRFVFKHNPLPFHQRAMAAAIAAEAAGRQGKFWPMHDLLFADMKSLDDEDFKAHARKLKLDKRRFKRDLADPQLQQKIERQQEEGNALGARGTPAFFINGRFLSGAQPLESFTALIDEEMEVARKRQAPGQKGAEVYDQLMAEAAVPPTSP